MAYKVLVVPTIRENCIKKFLIDWERFKDWDDIIVVEDNPHKTFKLDVKFHYSWEDIDNELGDKSWIVSRKDSGIRSFGFLQAYKMGADYIFSADDDTVLTEDGFCQKHIDMMEKTPRWTESILGLRTRGLPYKNLGVMTNIVANMGFWNNVPDFDAIQTLSKGDISGFVVPDNVDRIIPNGQYTPVCGMNYSFKREVAVLSYFPLMGENSPYKRFDDIFYGIIFKKICDHLRLCISVGGPQVVHTRASNPFTNLVKESTGIIFNEQFWRIIDTIPLKENSPKACMTEVGVYLSNYVDISSSPEMDYLNKLGKAIVIWAELFT